MTNLPGPPSLSFEVIRQFFLGNNAITDAMASGALDDIEREMEVIHRFFRQHDEFERDLIMTMSEDSVYRELYLDKQDQLLNALQKAIDYNRTLTEFEKFHPRAMKLLRKQKPFLVVAQDEPYYVQVYSLIRAHEMKSGRWSEEDEQLYRAAITKDK